MRLKVTATIVFVGSAAIAAAVFVQSHATISAQAQTRSAYLPEYTASGDLILPKNFHDWVHVGSEGTWTPLIPK